MGSFSLVHWLLVILVVLLVFGPSKLASVGKGLGEGIRNFKKGLGSDGESEADPKQLAEKREAAKKES